MFTMIRRISKRTLAIEFLADELPPKKIIVG
jgi:hypothetical protein